MSHDRWGNILKQTRFPIPLLIPNASIFHHWHDLAWLHPMTDMCVPSDMTHTAWIAGTNRIPHQPSHHSKLLWRSRFQNLIWHHSSNQKQIDMVMIWTTQSLLDDPLTSASSSSSSESGRGTWMQKRPLMQKADLPISSHHVSMKDYLCDVEQKWIQYILTERILKPGNVQLSTTQSSHDPPFFVSIDGRNDSPIAATNWNILLEMILLLLCANWQGSWTCLCN